MTCRYPSHRLETKHRGHIEQIVRRIPRTDCRIPDCRTCSLVRRSCQMGEGRIMEANLDKWTIVVVGQWNPRIFAPPWVAKNLFPSADLGDVQMEVLLLPVDYHARLSVGSVVLIPTNEKVIVGVRSAADEALAAAEDVALRVLDLLPHTPVTGVGVNFGYVEDDPSPRLLGLLGLPDLGELSNYGAQISRTEITRRLQIDTHALNLTLALEDGRVELGLNFHHDTPDTVSAANALRGQVRKLRMLGYNVLQEVYGLTAEEAQADEDSGEPEEGFD